MQSDNRQSGINIRINIGTKGGEYMPVGCTVPDFAFHAATKMACI